MRKTALDVLAVQDVYDLGGAKALLEEYEFPKTGLFNDYTFALAVEQTGHIPEWSERFKKNNVHAQSSNLGCDENEITARLGEELGSGAFGRVYLDKYDSNYVIKSYETEHFEELPEGLQEAFQEAFSSEVRHLSNRDPGAIPKEESELFLKYYGEESSMIYTDTNGKYYNRMFRIPGEAVSRLPRKSLPVDAVERYVSMLERLNHIGVMHGDLHPGNVMWDPVSKTFFPIDINNMKEIFFKENAVHKTARNYLDEVEWNKTIRLIKSKIDPFYTIPID
jgi:serine/threonine protein kinase